MPNFLKLGVKLMLIAGGSAAILAFVNEQTKGRIEDTQQEERARALCEVVPQAKAGAIEPIKKDGVEYYIVYKTSAKKEIAGYGFIAEEKGYSSVIRIIVGVNPQAKIMGVKILRQKETPGLGAKIEGEKFLKQFKGRGVKDLDDVDTITGATISSCAVIKGISKKLEQLITTGNLQK